MKASRFYALLGLVATASAEASEEYTQHVIDAHGILMGLAFAVFFPLGAILVRVLSFKGLVWWHATWQLVSYVIAIVGLGLGAWIAATTDQIDQAHPIIGIIVVGLLLFQPILGLIHHYIFRRTSKKTFWIWAHIWYGRAVLILGAINGGLGLQLSGSTTKGEIAYGVIAGVMFLVWFAVVLTSTVRRTVGQPEGETGEKISGNSSSPTVGRVNEA